MGTLIDFPEVKRRAAPGSIRTEPAVIVILPVVRIERHAESGSGHFEPDAGAPRGGGGRRRARRS